MECSISWCFCGFTVLVLCWLIWFRCVLLLVVTDWYVRWFGVCVVSGG